MAETRTQFLERLLQGYRTYYDVELAPAEQAPLVATAFFHAHSASYVLVKTAELWSANCDEYIYIFTMPVLTKALYEQCLKTACDDGFPRVTPGEGHMSTFVDAVFVCDECEPDAAKALRRCRIRKSFQFSLQGWMEVHTAVVLPEQKLLVANHRWCETAKYLKNVLHRRKRSVFAPLGRFLEILKD